MALHTDHPHYAPSNAYNSLDTSALDSIALASKDVLFDAFKKTAAYSPLKKSGSDCDARINAWMTIFEKKTWMLLQIKSKFNLIKDPTDPENTKDVVQKNDFMPLDMALCRFFEDLFNPATRKNTPAVVDFPVSNAPRTSMKLMPIITTNGKAGSPPTGSSPTGSPPKGEVHLSVERLAQIQKNLDHIRERKGSLRRDSVQSKTKNEKTKEVDGKTAASSAASAVDPVSTVSVVAPNSPMSPKSPPLPPTPATPMSTRSLTVPPNTPVSTNSAASSTSPSSAKSSDSSHVRSNSLSSPVDENETAARTRSLSAAGAPERVRKKPPPLPKNLKPSPPPLPPLPANKSPSSNAATAVTSSAAEEPSTAAAVAQPLASESTVAAFANGVKSIVDKFNKDKLVLGAKMKEEDNSNSQ